MPATGQIPPRIRTTVASQETRRRISHKGGNSVVALEQSRACRPAFSANTGFPYGRRVPPQLATPATGAPEPATARACAIWNRHDFRATLCSRNESLTNCAGADRRFLCGGLDFQAWNDVRSVNRLLNPSAILRFYHLVHRSAPALRLPAFASLLFAGAASTPVLTRVHWRHARAGILDWPSLLRSARDAGRSAPRSAAATDTNRARRIRDA